MRLLISLKVKIHWSKQIRQHLSSSLLSSLIYIESIETRLEYINLIQTTIRFVQWNALSLPEWIDILHQCRLIESLRNVWPKYAFHETSWESHDKPTTSSLELIHHSKFVFNFDIFREKKQIASGTWEINIKLNVYSNKPINGIAFAKLAMVNIN